MSAASYTPEEEARYRLPPLPEVPFIGHAESGRRNVAYEDARKQYRKVHPIVNPVTGEPL